MNPILPLLAPLAVLLPGVAGVELAREAGLPQSQSGKPDREDVAEQVSIEQRVTIRIAPRGPAAPDFDSLPSNGVSPRYSEKKMGKCIPVSGIVGVQYRDANRLVLYLRDKRMVSVTLEKSCRARDFYSGFYVARNNDGQLCVERDEILSRSGANCTLSAMHQLVEAD